jgi:hypothetical protein
VTAFLTYLLLFLTPLIVIPRLSLQFEPPKVLISEVLIELIVIYVIATGKFSLKRVSRPLVGIVGGLFLLSLFHLLTSPTQQNLFGNVFRLQGTVLFWHFLALTLVTQNIHFRLKEKYIYLASFVGVCAASLMFGSNGAGRLIGSLGEPNALGAVVILIFPFVFLNFKSVWLRIVVLIASFGVINYSESKSALIALGLELVFLLLIKIFKGKYLIATTICLIILGFSLTLPILERAYFLRTNTDPLNFRFEDRAEIWKVASVAGLNSPIFGSGIDSIQTQINLTSAKMNSNSQYLIIDSSHNLLLDYWIWGGITGLILISTLIVRTLKNLINKKMPLELMLFIGLLTVVLFNPTTVTALIAFWWVIGRSFSKAEN